MDTEVLHVDVVDGTRLGDSVLTFFVVETVATAVEDALSGVDGICSWPSGSSVTSNPGIMMAPTPRLNTRQGKCRRRCISSCT